MPATPQDDPRARLRQQAQTQRRRFKLFTRARFALWIVVLLAAFVSKFFLREQWNRILHGAPKAAEPAAGLSDADGPPPWARWVGTRFRALAEANRARLAHEPLRLMIVRLGAGCDPSSLFVTREPGVRDWIEILDPLGARKAQIPLDGDLGDADVVNLSGGAAFEPGIVVGVAHAHGGEGGALAVYQPDGTLRLMLPTRRSVRLVAGGAMQTGRPLLFAVTDEDELLTFRADGVLAGRDQAPEGTRAIYVASAGEAGVGRLWTFDGATGTTGELPHLRDDLADLAAHFRRGVEAALQQREADAARELAAGGVSWAAFDPEGAAALLARLERAKSASQSAADWTESLRQAIPAAPAATTSRR